MKTISKHYLFAFIELLFAPFFGVTSLVLCGWLKNAEDNPDYSIPFFRDKKQLSRWISIFLWIGLVLFIVAFLVCFYSLYNKLYARLS